MRKFFGALIGLTACGGGGSTVPSPTTGGGSGVQTTPTPAPTSSPGSGTQAKYATPTFHITIPKRAGSKKLGKTALFISTAGQWISITLTSVNGNAPGTVTGTRRPRTSAARPAAPAAP